MADLRHYRLIDGTGIKAIPMEALPPEAWQPLDGRDTDTKLVDTVAFLYRCIDVRSAAVAGVPWQITRGESEVWTSEDPNPPTGAQYEWLKLFPSYLPRIEESLSVGSEAFLFKLRTASRMLGLQWLMPSSMKPQWTAEGITAYRRTLSSVDVRWLAPEDVVYIWLQGQSETTPKRSPMSAAMTAANVLYNADQFAKQFFERGAIKATILAVPATTQRKDKEELESWFQRAMTGLGKAWASKAINADAVTAIPIGEGLESLNNGNLTSEKREDIATAMGVPHSLVLSNAANFATSESDRFNFYDTTIIPECTRIELALNEQLFDPLGLQFRFMPQEMSIYQEDEEQRANAVLQYVQAGMPLSIAVQILGVSLPDGVEPDSLESRELYQSNEEQPEEENEEDPDEDDSERTEEMDRFKRWCKRRMNSKKFDLMAFDSAILTSADRAAVLAELKAQEGGAADDAPFPVPDWTDYP